MENVEFAAPNAREVSKYLEVLACPTCKSPLAMGADMLICGGCRRTYPVAHNCPILLPPMVEHDSWGKWKLMDDVYLQSYRQWTREEHLSVRAIYENFIDWCGIRDIRNVRLLDVGGGNGVMRAMYWHHPETIDYFNVDPKIEGVHGFYLDLYPQLKTVDFPYVVGVAEALPLRSGIFDLCVTAESVDHWFDPESGFHEISRCLKPGGKLYVLAPRHDESRVHPAGVIVRAVNHIRTKGIASLGRRTLAKLCERNREVPPSFEHMYNFGSVEDLTKRLTMFDVRRTQVIEPKSSLADGHFFIECIRRGAL